MRHAFYVQSQLEEFSAKTFGTSSQFDTTAARQANSPTPALPTESIIGTDDTKLVAGRTSPRLNEVKIHDYAFDVSLLPKESQFLQSSFAPTKSFIACLKPRCGTLRK